MFVSQLYTGSISDKQIVTRSGFLELLSSKKEVSEVEDGDGIMADKGFDTEGDLKKIGLQLNILPFWKKNHSLMRMRSLEHKLLQNTGFMWKEL